MKWLSRLIYHKFLGWELKGSFPDLKKYVIIVVPHTSWHDFYIGLLVRGMTGERMNYVGKKELFDSPFGWYFRWTGGAPIDRGQRSNTVDAIIDLFNTRDEFRLSIAPEGTRKKVNTLKTGFYYVAKGAGVPIVMVAFDFENKEVRISEPFYPGDDMESDMNKIHAYFKGVKGKKPEYSFEP